MAGPTATTGLTSLSANHGSLYAVATVGHIALNILRSKHALNGVHQDVFRYAKHLLSYARIAEVGLVA